MGETITNEGKSLVLQFSAKHEQKLDCGGGYVKLLPSTTDASAFGGDTPYAVMFGPDICGYATRRVHVILTDSKGTNQLVKKTIPCETDELTHVYTLRLHANNTYEVLIDNEEKERGSLEEDFEFLPPKTIADPEATKPEDWDDRATIPDESDVKPEGYDDVPPTVADPEASKPEDWDDDEDGDWEPPMIDNPEYKGAWEQKTIGNPAYKGAWAAPEIPNPAYNADDAAELYKFSDLRYVGFELWQVTAGTIFDNVLVTDDAAYAARFAEETWGASKEGERAMYEAHAAEKAKEEEAARAKAEEEAAADKALEEEEEEEEEEEDYDEDATAPATPKDEL